MTGAAPDRLVLSGVAVAFIATSLGNLAIFLGDPRAAHTVIFWMLGGLGLAEWSHLVYPAATLAASSRLPCPACPRNQCARHGR